MISIVLPTISGREESLQQVIDSYVAHTKVKYEIVVIKNAPTWPEACNAGFQKAEGDIILFGADDLDATAGWHRDILKFFKAHDELPAPYITDYEYDAPMMNAEDGEDGAYAYFTRVPIMRRDQWERIGVWPPLIYYADIWVSEKARTLGIRTKMLYSFRFVHRWCQIGRVDSRENLDAAGWHLNREREKMT